MESLEKKASDKQISLINSLKVQGIVTDPLIEQVLKSVDRADFVSKQTPISAAYEDCPQLIGYSATISAPQMHAYALVLLLFTAKLIGIIATLF